MVEKQLIGSRDRYEIWLGPESSFLPGLAFEPYLYNRREHLLTQRPDNPHSVWLWDKVAHKTLALLRADIADAQVRSLPNAPFGGLQFAPGTPPDALVLLLSCLENWCADQQCRRLVIKTPPSGYGEGEFRVAREAYLLSGFQVAQRHTNHHIVVSKTPFMDIISGPERRRVRKCLRAGFRAGLWPNPDPGQVYDFLLESRNRQGYSLPLDRPEMIRLLTDLPDSVRVFTVRDGRQVISLTVAIRVSEHVLYNFCPADDLDYRTFSPTVLLNAALYSYSQKEGIEVIDLGVSLDSCGREKASLIRFKENLGGQPSAKITYEKIFKTH